MNDNTESTRKVLINVINSSLPNDEITRHAELICQYGADNVWDTNSVSQDFIIEGFMAPFVVVTRKSDHIKGTLTFAHQPRFYFDFTPV